MSQFDQVLDERQRGDAVEAAAGLLYALLIVGLAYIVSGMLAG